MVSDAQKASQRKYIAKVKDTAHFIELTRGYSSAYGKKRYKENDEYRAQRLRSANLYAYYKNDDGQFLKCVRKLFL
jgi:hypothetical protein